MYYSFSIFSIKKKNEFNDLIKIVYEATAANK